MAAGGYLGYRSTAEADNGIPEAPPTVRVAVGNVELSVSAPGRLSDQETWLGMGANGPLAEILVSPGSHVKEGDLLAVLGNGEELAAAVAAADVELAAARRVLQDLKQNAPLTTAEALLNLANAREELRKAEYRNMVQQEGHRAAGEVIAAAEANLILAENAVSRAERVYNRYSGKPADNPARAQARAVLAAARQQRDSILRNLNWYRGHPTELQQLLLDADVAVAEAAVAVAESAYARVEEGPDPLLLAEAAAQVLSAEAQLKKSQAELEGSELRAPYNGVVLDVRSSVGDIVSAGDGFIKFADLGTMEVAGTIIEEDLPLVEEGQRVQLYFDAYNEADVFGRVERVVPERVSEERPLYMVYISLDEIPEGMAPGMTVDAKIVIDSREDVLTLPRSLVRAGDSGQAMVEVWTGTAVEKRKVKVGLRGDTTVEILSGLSEGEDVVAK